jgi:hypothetical protein
MWRNNGARNVVVLFTKDRKIADSDSFTAIIRKAGGVWYEGGRQFHIVQDYGGTKTEREIMAVLDRGGVVGGSSAGATILGDFMVRGAPSNNNMIMGLPGVSDRVRYLRNTAIDQHVVARSRLPDLADSIITRYPNLLGISEDEGTAWVVRGDTGRIIGRSKAFVYNGEGDATDPGSPFVTLFPGDKYDLNATHHQPPSFASSLEFIRSMFAKCNDGSAPRRYSSPATARCSSTMRSAYQRRRVTCRARRCRSSRLATSRTRLPRYARSCLHHQPAAVAQQIRRPQRRAEAGEGADRHRPRSRAA